MQQQDRLDALIAAALPPEWPIARLDPVMRALLRQATTLRTDLEAVI